MPVSKNWTTSVMIVSLAMASALFFPFEFVISATVFALVVRGGLHLLGLAASMNAKFQELDNT